MSEMTCMERFLAALKLEVPDMVPTLLFPGIVSTRFVSDVSVLDYANDGVKMARAQQAFYREVGGDTMYLLSDMGLIVQGWGVKMKVPTDPLVHLMLGEFAVKEPADWEKLQPLDPKKDGRMHIYLNAAKTIHANYGEKVPVGVSLPGVLTTATHVCSMEDVMIHMLTEPDPLKKALKEVITPTVTDFINACAENGAAFTGYLTTRASKELTTLEQYREFGVPFDNEIFRKTPKTVHICHICGVEPMFEIISEYVDSFSNVRGISWWDRGAKPNLKEAKEKYGKKLCLVAGIDHTSTLITGKPEDVEKQVQQAIGDGGEGGGFILCPGCEVSPKTPIENLKASIKAARTHGRY